MGGDVFLAPCAVYPPNLLSLRARSVSSPADGVYTTEPVQSKGGHVADRIKKGAVFVKRTIQDTIVAGVAGSAAPAAFFSSSPSFHVPTANRRSSTTPFASVASRQLESTLNELQKILALMAASLIKGIDDKLSKLGSSA